MNIRVAIKSDATGISELVSSLSHFYTGKENDKLPTWFLSALEPQEFIKRIENSEYINLLYIQKNETTGYISMKRNGHLYHLFVSEKNQGKGIARKLWNEITRQCTLNIYFVKSSLYAVPVYEAFGFTKTGQQREKEGIYFQPMELVIKC